MFCTSLTAAYNLSLFIIVFLSDKTCHARFPPFFIIFSQSYYNLWTSVIKKKIERRERERIPLLKTACSRRASKRQGTRTTDSIKGRPTVFENLHITKGQNLSEKVETLWFIVDFALRVCECYRLVWFQDWISWPHVNCFAWKRG